ncbi:L-lactate permease [Corynebacterium cystitidis]|uniref:L-lactate permease n=1 Tax=Corynebacterium cystitidis DSM 20524 TaxID=1121357 RepID=A0A1H9S036_9CORY|nr:L-lactate permease [Corynebacterium cystitidis]WJY82157.1 Glycolate permease GlcA [Corynebacterium cystitidis DSM 20524]SER78288.1 lactate permease [Corynebacterium cystitidis DSM 20524]SNV78458.1 putative L-lactate permease [Corynebacterium cystitidis]
MTTLLLAQDTYTPSTEAVAGSVGWTALVAVLPLAAFFLFLMGFKWAAHTSAIASVVVALIIAVLPFGMPWDMAGMSLLQGICFGLFPIVYIIWMAVWIYDLTVKSGRFEDMRVIFSKIGKGDMRIQAMIIGFAFGGMLEALAGFGAPVAIVSSMLVAIGMKPMKAIVVTLVANAAPVAFGAMAIPVTTGASLAGLDVSDLAGQAGRLVGLTAFITPFLLLLIMDGKRGLRQAWPMAIVLGISFGGGQFLASNYFAYELTDVMASLVSLVAGIAFLAVWTPTTPEDQASQADTSGSVLTAQRGFLALFPYILIVVVFAITKLWRIGVDIPAALASTDIKFGWPGLYERLLTPAGEPSTSPIFNFNWLSSPGTILFFCGVITVLVYTFINENGRYSLGIGTGFAELFIGLNRMRMSYVTIAAVMGLAYVMNFSGQTAAIGALLAGTGAIFPLISPVLGWLGTFVTGSGTSSNALFAQMQATTAATIGVPEHVLVAANTGGATLGKMISPQTVALGAATVGLVGKESEIMKQTMKVSLGLLVFLGIVVFLQTTPILGWMVV